VIERQALDAWRALLDAMPEAAWLFGMPSREVLLVNAAACELLEAKAEALIGAGADSLLSSVEDAAWWASVHDAPLEGLHSQTALVRRDGRVVDVERSISMLPDGRHGLVSLRNVGAQQRLNDQREEALSQLQATLEATHEGILVLDGQGEVQSCNRRLAELWDMPQNLFEQRDSAAFLGWIERSLKDAQAWRQRQAELRKAPLQVSADRLALHTGQVLECSSRPLWHRGRPQGRVFSFRDLTASLAMDQRLTELATTDALTGLPNRRMMADAVATAAGQARREGRSFALLVIDLDHFRHINDTLGHATGDLVLVDVTRRIQRCLRSEDCLARIGGDQFALLVNGANAVAAEATARRVLTLVAQPCEIDGLQFTLTCSIGVAMFPGHGGELEQLISHAEGAMRQAKDNGRAGYRLHQGRSGVDLRKHMTLDHAMRQALVSGRFRLHYQPQIDLATGELRGAEALIRWRDPELGEVSPGQFIPVAEDTGYIIAIGDWVLSQAVRQAALWHERKTPVTIAVNVSALQFQQAQFVERVASVLAVSGLPPSLLELELTESILVRDAEEALMRLHALSKLGVRLSIDDFGTGYSSLAYLKRFPIDTLKIDRSFVKGLPQDDSDAGIVRAILQMARALNMKVVAEGVETEAQRRFLCDAGCDMFQGFLFAPALDSLSFERRLLQPREVLAAPAMRLVHG
jgi:diguanylate cyclase (GGDEF)-like protein